MIDETDAAELSVLERGRAASDKPVIIEADSGRPVLVETTPVGPTLVEPTSVRPVLVETTVDVPVVVPAMRVPEDRPPAAPKIAVPQLRIGPFQVSDLSQADVVAAIVSGSMESRAQRAWVSYALHVGGLNSRRDSGYLAAMSRADLVYADGMSVIVLAKLAGAQAAERAGTTDIGWTVIRELGVALGRPAKVALLGGPEGLTRRAARVIEAEAGAEVVFTEHGYHKDWSPVLDRLADSGCDLLLVGLGAPHEMKWVDANVADLPPCLVMTCGGWFGFITKDEKRAPQWVRDYGLEWTYRVAQSPRRLIGRYMTGAVSTIALSLLVVRNRLGSG